MAASAESPTPAEAECRRLTEALTLAERDRQLLGYEIHDGVVQDLTAAAMLLENAARQASFATAESKQSFDNGVRLLQGSIAAARRLVQGSPVVEIDQQGLVAGLRRLVDKFRADHGLAVALASDIDEWKLPSSVTHLLLRIAQESLHNVAKHAQASEVEARLAIRDEKLEMEIADNGVGFDPALIPAGHFGLEGVRARARVLGAELLIDTAPQHGTRIIVRMTPPAV